MVEDSPFRQAWSRRHQHRSGTVAVVGDVGESPFHTEPRVHHGGRSGAAVRDITPSYTSVDESQDHVALERLQPEWVVKEGPTLESRQRELDLHRALERRMCPVLPVKEVGDVIHITHGGSTLATLFFHDYARACDVYDPKTIARMRGYHKEMMAAMSIIDANLGTLVDANDVERDQITKIAASFAVSYDFARDHYFSLRFMEGIPGFDLSDLTELKDVERAAQAAREKFPTVRGNVHPENAYVVDGKVLLSDFGSLQVDSMQGADAYGIDAFLPLSDGANVVRVSSPRYTSELVVPTSRNISLVTNPLTHEQKRAGQQARVAYWQSLTGQEIDFDEYTRMQHAPAAVSNARKASGYLKKHQDGGKPIHAAAVFHHSNLVAYHLREFDRVSGTPGNHDELAHKVESQFRSALV